MKLRDYYKKYKLDGLYIKIMIVFSAILIVSVILSLGIIYNSLSNRLKGQILNLTVSGLEHVRMLVDNEMEELYIYSGTVGENIPMEKNYSDLSTNEKQELSKDFFGRFYTYSYFDSVYIYYIEDKKIITNRFGTMQFEDFSDRSWEEIYEQKRKEKNQLPVLIYDRLNPVTNENVMTYIYEYPKYSDHPKAVLVVNVNAQRAFDMRDLMPEYTQVLILDSADQLVYGDKGLYASLELENMQEERGDNYIQEVSASGWKYIAVFDEKELNLDSRKALWLVFLVLAVVIPAAIMLWVFFSFKLYSPLIYMLERLMRISGNERVAFDERKQLNYAIDSMEHIHNQITDISKRNEEILKCTVITNLCSGDFDTEKTLRDMQEIGFSMDGTGFAVFAAEIIEGELTPAQNRNNYQVIKLGVSNAFEKALQEKRVVLAEFVSRNRLLVLAELPSGIKSGKQIAKTVEASIREQYNIVVLIGCGNIAEDISQIAVAYLETIDALHAELDNYKKAAEHNPAAEPALKEDSTIQIVREYIDNHYSEDITLASMAEKAYLSPNYLSTKFKKIIGVGMLDYLNDLRIAKAKELLLKTNKNNEKIAEELGFTNVRSFLRSFKAIVGQTPTEYRNSNIKS